MADIHFIGMGNMGLPMATNLAKSHDIRVHDIGAAQREAAEQAGLQLLDDAEVGAGAGVLVTMLPAGDHVRAAVIGADLGARMAAGGLLVDCSTTDRDTALALAEYAAGHGLHAIDSPVSGGIKGAQAASLTFMCGGQGSDVERARPLLQAMGQKLFHAGGHGAGQVAKMCNNMLLAICMGGTCEALNLGRRLGLDPAVLSQIMHQASGTNWVLDCYNPWPGVMEGAVAGEDYRGGFKSALMLKDLGLAQAAAEDSGSPLHFGALARSLYQRHCEGGSAELDFGSLLRRYLEEGRD